MYIYINMDGGALIAEGGFGCVHYPALDCDGNEINDKKIISKLQIYNKNARNEIKISNLLKKINGFMNHFSPIVGTCFMEKKKLKTKDCEVVEKHYKMDKKLILMKMIYVNGSSLLRYMIDHKNSKYIVNNIINGYNHLLKSLKLLIKSKICHFDLKGDNILFNEDMNLPIIIDYGISIQIDDIRLNTLRDYFYVYGPEYYIWPLDVHYLCFIINENPNPTKNELKNICVDYVKYNRGLKSLSPEFKKKYLNACYKQLLRYNKIEYKKRINKLLNYWTTWDNYALSIMYMRFFSYIYEDGFIENNFLKFFSKLLLRNIHPNPRKRLSVEETIVTFNTFLYKKDVNNLWTFENIADIFAKNRDDISKKLSKDIKMNQFLTKTIERN